MGAFLLIEAGVKVVEGTRTTIGGMTLFGETIWAGWPMLAVLVYTSVPSFILGRIKLKIAPQLHDKVLFADAKMMKADWMAELATACGVIGVGLGFWWADPLAAILVSVNILHDGMTNIGRAVADLIDERPKKTDGSDFESLPEEVARYLRRLDWVEDAEVRMREDGHVFFGEAFVVPRTTDNLVRNIERAVEDAKGIDWRLHELVIMPVARLPRS
jgi:divalent metal cation (Fe/Co/Zn/Cd) transporter